jgi:hypothetical protein
VLFLSSARAALAALAPIHHRSNALAGMRLLLRPPSASSVLLLPLRYAELSAYRNAASMAALATTMPRLLLQHAESSGAFIYRGGRRVRRVSGNRRGGIDLVAAVVR